MLKVRFVTIPAALMFNLREIVYKTGALSWQNQCDIHVPLNYF